MNNKSINWKDPLYLLDSLTEEENKISITAKNFCNEFLLKRVKNDNIGFCEPKLQFKSLNLHID